MPDLVWSNDRITQLRHLWASGDSASIIGNAMGITRSAVIGKVHRLGLSGRVLVNRLREPKGPQVAKQHRVVKRITRLNGNSNYLKAFTSTATDIGPMRTAEVEPRHLTLSDLNESTCKWPLGDGPFTFCGHAPLKGLPYCAPHQRIGTQDPKRREPLRPKMPTNMADGVTGRSVFA